MDNVHPILAGALRPFAPKTRGNHVSRETPKKEPFDENLCGDCQEKSADTHGDRTHPTHPIVISEGTKH